MGGQRTDLERLKKIIPDPYGQATGLVPVVSTYVDDRGLTQYLYTLQTVAPGSAQTKIQFQYNGANLGTAGSVDTVNIASSWATFARSVNTVTLTIATPVTSINSLTGALSATSTDGSLVITPSGSTIDFSTNGSTIIRARVATTAALPTNVYNNGSSGVGATLTGVSVGVLTIDSVAVVLNDIVIVKDEVAQSNNGDYKVTTLGTVGVAYVLTRDTRMDGSTEFTGSISTTGPDGTTNKDTAYECTAVSPVTVGTTAITFQAIGGSFTPPVTTKGDLFGFSTVPARIPIGTDGQVLTADSAQTLGLKWDTPSASSPLTTKGDLYGFDSGNARFPVGSDGQSPIADSTQTLGVRYADAFRGPGCNFTNGDLLLSGTLVIEVPNIPYGGTITGWTIVGNVSGSASIVVSHSTYSAYDTMTTLFTATLSSAIKNQATGLSNALAKGDILRFSGSGFASLTRCTIVLSVTP